MRAILTKLLSGRETKKGALVAVLSAIAGFLALMFLPIAVLSALGGVEAPELDYQFDQSAWINSLDDEQQTKLNDMETIGLEIQSAMSTAGIPEETIKAQLIYLSCLEDVGVDDYSSYVNLFVNATDDKVLIDSINSTYGVEIVFEEYMRSYVAVMNLILNPYMFNDSTTKNATDLSAWAENAYLSGWGYETGMIGEMNKELHYRTADNEGLVLGYLKYNPTDKIFEVEPTELSFTEHGEVDTMPDVKGIGVYDGTDIAVYVGDGEIIFSSADSGYVVKEQIENREWASWCTFNNVTYPQEVKDAIKKESTKTDEIE